MKHPFEDLDAFKVCHELTLRMHSLAEQIDERDPEIAGLLWFSALVASSRIARGAGFMNKKLFTVSLDRTLGALSEIAYHMNMARAMALISEQTYKEIEGLRGRCVFYTTKLIFSLQPVPGQSPDL